MFGDIVVAVDGSAASQGALNHAVNLARQNAASLSGVFVIDAGWPDYIGNDWQSAKGARQPFLDYIHAEQEGQARAAQRQFEDAAADLPRARFELRSGDPVSVLIDIANDDRTGLLVLNKQVFQVSGRPSLKTLGKRVGEKAQRPVLLIP